MVDQLVVQHLVSLKSGERLGIGSLQVTLESTGLIVTSWSSARNLENITRSIAIVELKDAIKYFDSIINSSAVLINHFKRTSKIFRLLFDDYGKGSILICQMENDQIKWGMDLV